MKKLYMALAVLGFAAPVFADQQQQSSAQATVLDDATLDQVAAGCDTSSTPGAVAPVTNNINISPIVVNQTAVAFNTQSASNQAANHSNGHGKGLAKQLNKQNATAVAMNVANINYTVKF
jgi:hypothetical protein